MASASAAAKAKRSFSDWSKSGSCCSARASGFHPARASSPNMATPQKNHDTREPRRIAA
jgi:hypothetical protein